MNIEISNETSRLLSSALAEGPYSSADELIAAMVRQNQPTNGATTISEMPEHLDVDQLALEQGVEPISDFRELRAKFWPEGESVEDFLKTVDGRSRNDSPRAHQ
ncbi:unnamed protein product [Ectocarpus sp. 4 AP-2014]